jgi:hypothetical protein
VKKILAALLLCLPCLAAAIPSEVTAEYQVITSGVVVGRVKESFVRKGDTYTIRSVSSPEGMLKMLMDDQWELSSSGRIVAAGLQPLAFGQHRARDGKRDVDATFDWSRGVMLSTYEGKQSEVPVQRATQDRISIMYQFMNLERLGETVEFPMTNGRKVDVYTYKLVGEVRLETPAGPFDTVHYQRVVADPKDRRAEVWIAKDRFNFPVRIVFDDPKGLRLEQTIAALQVR